MKNTDSFHMARGQHLTLWWSQGLVPPCPDCLTRVCSLPQLHGQLCANEKYVIELLIPHLAQHLLGTKIHCCFIFCLSWFAQSWKFVILSCLWLIIFGRELFFFQHRGIGGGGMEEKEVVIPGHLLWFHPLHLWEPAVYSARLKVDRGPTPSVRPLSWVNCPALEQAISRDL